MKNLIIFEEEISITNDNEHQSDEEVRGVLDGDDLLRARDEESLAHLSTKAKEQFLNRRRCNEEIEVCLVHIKQFQLQHGMEVDPTTLTQEQLYNRNRIVLCYAAALEGVSRRNDGIDALRLHLGIRPKWECCTEDDDFPSDENMQASLVVALALAKLYFKDNQKKIAMAWCVCVLDKIRNNEVSCCPKELVSDAYHLAGWIKIHDDDHTGAYELWTEGYKVVPDCDTLERQYRKRACWDSAIGDHKYEEVTDPLLLGRGAHGDGVFDHEDFDVYSVPEHNRKTTRALALFRSETQKNELVFRTRHPVLTPEECKKVLEEVELFHETCRHGKWDTVRKSSVKTTDVAVEDIPALRPWLRDLLKTRLYPLVAVAYPELADGSTLDANRIRVHDAFIVRYDADKDKSCSLPEHCDTSAVSFTVALNSNKSDNNNANNGNSSSEFEGGGTWFEALGDSHKSGKVVDCDIGQCVAFAGPLRHAGFPVTSGTRFILVLFLYIDQFSYGSYLQNYDKSNTREKDGEGKEDNSAIIKQPKVRPSGDTLGGFVVYKQTVELVGMLNRCVESVLD